jgi:hypothetical protein
VSLIENIFFFKDQTLSLYLILSHGELRTHEVAADEEAVAEHLDQGGHLSQGRLLLVFAELSLKKEIETFVSSWSQSCDF